MYTFCIIKKQNIHVALVVVLDKVEQVTVLAKTSLSGLDFYHCFVCCTQRVDCDRSTMDQRRLTCTFTLNSIDKHCLQIVSAHSYFHYNSSAVQYCSRPGPLKVKSHAIDQVVFSTANNMAINRGALTARFLKLQVCPSMWS